MPLEAALATVDDDDGVALAGIAGVVAFGASARSAASLGF